MSHFNTGTSLADPNSPAWVSGSVAAIVVITQDYLTLDQKLLNVQRLSEHMQIFQFTINSLEHLNLVVFSQSALPAV